MASKTYPLEPLVEVRKSHADAAQRELGSAIREREARLTELDAARARTLEHAEARSETERAERDALNEGALRAVDLLRQDAWQLERAREAERLLAAERLSAEAAVAATDEENRVREETATRLGELKAVERDRARFLEAKERAAAAKEEEAAEEAWRPR